MVRQFGSPADGVAGTVEIQLPGALRVVSIFDPDPDFDFDSK